MSVKSANRILLVSAIIAVAFPIGVFIWQKQLPLPDAPKQSVFRIQEQPNTTKTAPSVASVEPTYDGEPNHATQEVPHTVASIPPETEHPVALRSTNDGRKKNLFPSSEATYHPPRIKLTKQKLSRSLKPIKRYRQKLWPGLRKLQLNWLTCSPNTQLRSGEKS